jgi:hypothetical protein
MPSKKKADSTLVPSWLLAGPFESPGAISVLSSAHLPEEDLAPSAREKLGGKGWSRVESRSDFVDLLAQDFRVKTHCAAYAFTYVHAKDAGVAKLLVGSDDGVAVWLNGERVWFNDVQRGHTAGEDVVKVRLNKGWNRLLLKISQVISGWGFSCAIAAKTKLRFALDNPSRKKFPGPKAPRLALGVALPRPRERHEPGSARTEERERRAQGAGGRRDLLGRDSLYSGSGLRDGRARRRCEGARGGDGFG